MISRELSEAMTELNEVFNNTSIDVLKKIPKSFLQFVNDNTSETYKFEYDKSKSLKEQNLKPKTKGLIALIYRDFLCEDDERQMYKEKVLKNIQEIELEKHKKYNPDTIFENKKNIDKTKLEQNEILEETNLISKQDNLFIRLINKIKSIFS